MKNLFLIILISFISSISTQAAGNDIAVNTLPVSNVSTATSTFATSSLVATSTLSVSDEVDANYSEILGLRDCTLLSKRVSQRISKISDRLDKQSKSVDTLIYQIDAIDASNTVKNNNTNPILATDTAASGTQISTSTSLEMPELVSVLKDKMYVLSTTTVKYVKGLKSIDASKCQSSPKTVKTQILSTKPVYKDLLIADNDLKSYIKVDIKNALLSLREVSASDTESTEPISVLSTQTATSSDKDFWSTLKGLFK